MLCILGNVLRSAYCEIVESYWNPCDCEVIKKKEVNSDLGHCPEKDKENQSGDIYQFIPNQPKNMYCDTLNKKNLF